MFDCFKTKDRGPKAHKPKKKEIIKLLETKVLDGMIAIPGHQASGYGNQNGMSTYKEEQENFLNHRAIIDVVIHPEIKGKLALGPLRYEKSNNYSSWCRRAVKECLEICEKRGWNPNKVAVIEFHINDASNPEALGAFMGVSDHASAVLLHHVSTQWSEKFNISLRNKYYYEKEGKDIKLRGIKKSRSGSGYGFTNKMSDAGFISGFWEPYFGGHKNSECIQFLDDWEGVGLQKTVNFWVGITLDLVK